MRRTDGQIERKRERERGLSLFHCKEVRLARFCSMRAREWSDGFSLELTNAAREPAGMSN